MKMMKHIQRRIPFLITAALLSMEIAGECLAYDTISMKANTYSGSAFDIGVKEGRRILDDDPYFHYLLDAPVFTRTTPENFKRASELLQQFDPPLLEEMKGFARAASVKYEDVVVKLSGYGFTTPPFAQGCTQIAILAGNTANGHTLVGRNYDFTSDKKLSDFRLVVLKPDSFQPSIGTSQFFFGRIEGMNASGLYAGISFGHGKGTDPRGFFFHIIVRILLDQCKTADEAVQLIRKIPHAGAYNYLIADKGNAYSVEVSPPKIAIRKSERNQLVTVNHYVSAEMKTEQKKLLPNSAARLQLAESRAPAITTVSDMRAFLSRHMNEGVCQHYYEQSLGTLWSGIFDLTAVKAGYVFGSPCKNDIVFFDFPLGDVNKSYSGALAENRKLE